MENNLRIGKNFGKFGKDKLLSIIILYRLRPIILVKPKLKCMPCVQAYVKEMIRVT